MQSIANVLSVFRIPSPTSSVILHLLLLLLLILVGPKSYGFGTEEVEERGGQGGREEEVVGET